MQGGAVEDVVRLGVRGATRRQCSTAGGDSLEVAPTTSEARPDDEKGTARSAALLASTLSDRQRQLLNAVRLHVNGARTDVVMAAFAAVGVDPCGNSEHLRAVAQLSVCVRLGEEPSAAALALLLGEEVAA